MQLLKKISVTSEKALLLRFFVAGALFGIVIAFIVQVFEAYIPEDGIAEFVLIVLLFPALIVEFIILPARQDLPQIIKVLISPLTLMVSYSFIFFVVANMYTALKMFRKNA